MLRNVKINFPLVVMKNVIRNLAKGVRNSPFTPLRKIILRILPLFKMCEKIDLYIPKTHRREGALYAQNCTKYFSRLTFYI